MKNNALVILVLIVVALAQGALRAQTDVPNADPRIGATVKWSNDLEEPSNADIKKIIATEGGGFYAFRERQGGVLSNSKAAKPIIEFYNSSMKLVRRDRKSVV